MKLIILVILFTSIFCLNSNNQENIEAGDIVYTFSSPAFYTYSPVYYSYTPASYYYTYDPFFGYYGSSYYLDYTYVVYPFYYRGEAPSNKVVANKEKRTASKEEMEKELKNLKKEIWGNDKFNTTEIRKNNKAYDSRWLIAQLKITRALEIEDSLKKQGTDNNKQPNNKVSAVVLKTNVDKEVKVETLKKDQSLNKTKNRQDDQEENDEMEESLENESEEDSRTNRTRPQARSRIRTIRSNIEKAKRNSTEIQSPETSKNNNAKNTTVTPSNAGNLKVNK